jgi:hypothetical protein
MKNLLLLILLTLCISSKSQILLGFPYDSVLSISKYYTEVEVKKGEENKNMIIWKSKDPLAYYCSYFFNNGWCNVYAIQYQYSYLTPTIKMFNDIYMKTSDSTWVDYNKDNMYVEIKKSESFYTIYYYTK